MPDNLNAADPVIVTTAPAVEGEAPVAGPAGPGEPPPHPDQEPTAQAEGTSGGEAPPVGTEASEPAPEPPPPSKKRWYVVKVQSGREDTIKDAIERRVKIDGLEEYF